MSGLRVFGRFQAVLRSQYLITKSIKNPRTVHSCTLNLQRHAGGCAREPSTVIFISANGQEKGSKKINTEYEEEICQSEKAVASESNTSCRHVTEQKGPTPSPLPQSSSANLDSGTKGRKVQSKRGGRKKAPVFCDPPLTKESLKNVSSVCAIVFGYYKVYATTMGRNLSLNNMVTIDVSTAVKEAHLHQRLLRQVYNSILPELPMSNLYVMETQNYVYKTLKRIKPQIHMQLVECTLKTVLSQQQRHSEHPVYFESIPGLVNMRFGLVQDGVRMPCKTIVEEIYNEDLTDTGIKIPNFIYTEYKNMKDIDRELMGSCILLGAAFWKHGLELEKGPSYSLI
ncbi:uncharacterized protein LOC106153485 [Lingula anatina]|uniref:Uncharacterized protein LOC106153485 n=1 Tax=Lingula anatina TaxID=7574 RepID=A0A1S3HA40_LINAN|nr:uncharacterized protein LOC106153485 [Lingula anatina]|eukprot:XP_013382887.1 uncharacterized protein LOC106153485 [Lingula anatina]